MLIALITEVLVDNKKISIQAALDYGTINECVELIREIQEQIDIIEIGTPQIFRYGVGLLTVLCEAFPKHTLLFDGKIVDAGAEETRIALEAGAGIVTVLAMAHNETIRRAVLEAHSLGGRVFADLLCVTDIAARAETLYGLGVDIVGLHIAVDLQNSNNTLNHEFEILSNIFPKERIAVAGGINPDMARQIAPYRPGIVIVGGALRKATDKQKLLIDIRAVMEE